MVLLPVLLKPNSESPHLCLCFEVHLLFFWHYPKYLVLFWGLWFIWVLTLWKMKGNNLVLFYYMLISNFLVRFDEDARWPFQKIEQRKLEMHILRKLDLYFSSCKNSKSKLIRDFNFRYGTLKLSKEKNKENTLKQRHIKRLSG